MNDIYSTQKYVKYKIYRANYLLLGSTEEVRIHSFYSSWIKLDLFSIGPLVFCYKQVLLYIAVLGISCNYENKLLKFVNMYLFLDSVHFLIYLFQGKPVRWTS